MNKILALIGLVALTGCYSTVDIKYSQDDENSCEYTEKYAERGNPVSLLFGTSDIKTTVYYDGMKCDKVINADLERGATKNAMFKVAKTGADVVIKK
jgi:hypothetical protein